MLAAIQMIRFPLFPCGGDCRQAAARLLPFRMLRLLAKPSVLCSCYHIVADAAPDHIRHLFAPRGVAEFERDLDFFSRNFRAVPPHGIDGLFEPAGRSRSNGFLVTFDDGLREVFEIAAPILQCRGIQAVFFVNPAFVDNRSLFYRHKASLLIEAMSGAASQARVSDARRYLAQAGVHAATVEAGILGIGHGEQHHLDALATLLEVDFADYLQRQRPYMTADQIRQLAARGHVIGAHSVDHPPFDTISAGEQIRQLEESIRFVGEEFGSRQPLFAFPFHAKGISPLLMERSLRKGVTLFTTAGHGMDVAARQVDRITMERPAPARTLVNLALVKRLLS
jgi:peptidoglycan/xylan/chitin deacetylase (PgdA/CDA1 family)